MCGLLWHSIPWGLVQPLHSTAHLLLSPLGRAGPRRRVCAPAARGADPAVHGPRLRRPVRAHVSPVAGGPLARDAPGRRCGAAALPARDRPRSGCGGRLASPGSGRRAAAQLAARARPVGVRRARPAARARARLVVLARGGPPAVRCRLRGAHLDAACVRPDEEAGTAGEGRVLFGPCGAALGMAWERERRGGVCGSEGWGGEESAVMRREGGGKQLIRMCD